MPMKYSVSVMRIIEALLPSPKSVLMPVEEISLKIDNFWLKIMTLSNLLFTDGFKFYRAKKSTAAIFSSLPFERAPSDLIKS